MSGFRVSSYCFMLTLFGQEINDIHLNFGICHYSFPLILQHNYYGTHLLSRLFNPSYPYKKCRSLATPHILTKNAVPLPGVDST